MSLGNGHGKSRLVLPNGDPMDRNAKDDQGRTLSRNATVYDAHAIAIEEGNKLHAFYLNQIPDFTARMIHDALIGFGLVPAPKLPDSQTGDASEHPEAPAVGSLPLESSGTPSDAPPPPEDRSATPPARQAP